MSGRVRFVHDSVVVGSLAIAGALVTANLHAQSQESAALEEVLVTATKRSQSIQEIPFTVQTVGEVELRDSGAYDFSGLVDRFAGVEFRSAQAGQGAIAIRGIAELNTANVRGGTGAAVGLYIDESPFTIAGLMPQSAMFDMQRVEVLKGPQGSLFGEGSLGGTVRLVTNRPDTSGFGAAVEHTYGKITDGGKNNVTNAMVNLPLVTDKLALRLVAFKMDEGGYITRLRPTTTVSFAPPPNPALGPGLPNVITRFTEASRESEVNATESEGARAQLEWTPSEDWRINLSGMVMDAERGSRNRGTLNKTLTISTDNEGSVDDLQQGALTIEKRFSSGVLTSASSFLDRQIDYRQDQLGIVSLGNAFVYPLSVFVTRQPEVLRGLRADFSVTTEDFSQEIRFVSALAGRTQFTIGAFYKDRDFGFSFATPTEPAVSAGVWNAAVGFPLFTQAGQGDILIQSAATTEQRAIFGEININLTDKTELLLGGRYFEESRSSQSSAFGVFIGQIPARQFGTDAEEDIFSPRISLGYRLSDDIKMYLTYSEGFRSGGQNDLNALVPQVDLDTYESEHLDTLEFGVKSSWLDGRMVFNAAMFYNDWKDLQVILAEGPGGAGEVLGNAAEARSQGIDLDLTWAPNEFWRLNAAATLMDASIRDSVLTVPNADGTQRIPVPVGTDIPQVAERQASLSATYRRPIGDRLSGFGRVAIGYISDSLTRLESIQGNQAVPARQSGYTRVDLRAGLSGDKWSASIFANNLLDREIILSTLGVDPIEGALSYILGAPRTVGVTVRLDF